MPGGRWDFKVGDLVFIKAAHFRTTRPLKKQSEKNLGPYDIITQAGKASLPFLTSESSPHRTPCLLCLSTGTLNTEHHSKSGSVSTVTY
jgi:hypothetical protein